VIYFLFLYSISIVLRERGEVSEEGKQVRREKRKVSFETRESRGKERPIIIGFSLPNFRAMVANS